MATKLLYLDDFDITECQAVVQQIQQADDGRYSVVLDRTCFYPRGGGQDWDTGKINNVQIEEVRLDEGGVVHHYNLSIGGVKVGDSVNCKVNTKRRQDNTLLHSAGHVIDMAMSELHPEWVPGRGAHFPHMSFVEYVVPENAVADEAFINQLSGRINQLLTSTYQNQIMFIDKSEMDRYCRHVPDNIPANKPTRIVLYAADFGIPCGGTHVRQLKDIGSISITKIKIKKGLAKVSYAVKGIN